MGCQYVWYLPTIYDRYQPFYSWYQPFSTIIIDWYVWSDPGICHGLIWIDESVGLIFVAWRIYAWNMNEWGYEWWFHGICGGYEWWFHKGFCPTVSRSSSQWCGDFTKKLTENVAIPWSLDGENFDGKIPNKNGQELGGTPIFSETSNSLVHQRSTMEITFVGTSSKQMGHCP